MTPGYDIKLTHFHMILRPFYCTLLNVDGCTETVTIAFEKASVIVETHRSSSRYSMISWKYKTYIAK